MKDKITRKEVTLKFNIILYVMYFSYITVTRQKEMYDLTMHIYTAILELRDISILLLFALVNFTDDNFTR